MRSLSSVWASLWFILNICLWQVCGTTRSSLSLWCSYHCRECVCVRVCVCVCVCAFVQNNREGLPPPSLLGMSHIWALCNPSLCFMCVNRQTLSSGLGPDSLWGSEWVRHSYQQQAQAASVSGSLHKESTRRDICTDTHTNHKHTFTLSQSYYSVACLAPP